MGKAETAAFSRRLETARRRAGFTSAREAAAAFGWNENTYKSRENGLRGIPSQDEVRKYARALKVPFLWLLAEEGPAPEWPDPEKARTIKSNPGIKSLEVKSSTIAVESYDLRRIVSFVLRAEGAEEEHADDLADTVVRCLSEPPLASLEGDVVRSFQVRFELQVQQPELSEQR